MPLSTPLSIQQLYDDNRESLELGWFAGFSGSERLISGDAASAADQVGHLNLIHPNRIQVLGNHEAFHLASLEHGALQELVARLYTARPAAIILADGITPPPHMIEAAETGSAVKGKKNIGASPAKAIKVHRLAARQ